VRKALGFYKVQICTLLVLLCGCVAGPASELPATLPTECASPGTIVSEDLPQPSRRYTYGYRVYLPPCDTADSESRYPVLYLVPGRSSSPDTWFAVGLPELVDRMVLSGDILLFIIVATENTDADPKAEVISKELIPFIEGQYPILNDRRYRAVAGGSLGGIAAYRLAFRYPAAFSSAGMFGVGAISGEEKQIQSWLSAMVDEDQIRVYLDTGDEDVFMLERAQVMKSMLDNVGIENQLYSGHGGHNYAYWVGNFEMYLRWLAKDWE